MEVKEPRRRYDTAQFERATLANGIPVWIQKSPIYVSDEGILIGFLPSIGSCRDPQGQKGIAHFFEHMPFKGTERFPSSSSISAAVDGRGGWNNATTSMEWTRFYVQLARPHFEIAAQVVSDLIARPLLHEEDILTERGVIADEYLRRMPFLGGSRVMEDLSRAVVGDYPYNHPVIGRRHAIKTMTRAKLVDFSREYYHSGNIQLIVGGAFAERPDILDVLNREFGTIRAGTPTPAIAAPQCDHRRFRLTDPRYIRSALVIGWMIAPPEGRKSYAMEVLLQSLGNGSDAPIVEHLRDRLGKTYSTNFVQFNHFVPFWSMGFALPIPVKYFSWARDMVMYFLEHPWTYVHREHMRNRDRRATSWLDPILACKQAVDEITTHGRPISLTEQSEEEDRLDIADVERWQGYFLSQPAVECEIRPTLFPRLFSFTGLT